jgi:hypothetical protein
MPSQRRGTAFGRMLMVTALFTQLLFPALVTETMAMHPSRRWS